MFDWLKKLFGGGGKKVNYTKVAGISKEGRQGIVKQHCKVGQTVFLKREPQNPYDKNAIGVWIQAGMTQKQIGYIPDGTNRRFAAAMDRGKNLRAKIKNITGGTKEHKTIGVNLEIEGL